MGRYLILILFCCFPFQIFAANTTAVIENVDMYIEESLLVVLYDIQKASVIERFSIGLTLKDEQGAILKPVSVTGDIGENIKRGRKHKIVWDVLKDGIEIQGSLKAIVEILDVTECPGGPSNAILSLVMPGLGDNFVSNNRKAKVKSYYQPIIVYGMIGLGYFEKMQSAKAYNNYENATLKKDIDNFYNDANNANHLFYIFCATGAAIWTADIIWVTVKGSHNRNKLSNYSLLKISPYFTSKNSGIMLSYNFK